MKRVLPLACVLLFTGLLTSRAPAPATGREHSKNQEGGFPAAVTDSLYDAHHPRLLFNRTELPALHQKVRDGGADAAAYGFIRHLVDSVYPTRTELELLDPTFGIDLPLKLGLAAYLETPVDKAALALGRHMTLFIADNFEPDDDVFFSSIRLLELVFGYDMFFGDGPQAERTYIRRELIAYIDTMMTVFNYERWLHPPYVSNKTAMVGSALGLAAICLQHEISPDRVDAVIARADRFVDAWSLAHLDPQGAYDEGVMYAGWSMRHLAYYFWARKRYYDHYDYSDQRDIRSMEKWIAYEVLPLGGARVNNINEAAGLNFPLSRHHTYLDWAQHEWGSTLSAWLWDRLVGPVYGYEWGEDADKTATVLWNGNLAPQQPDDLLAKHALWEHRGLYYYRTGWQRDASSDDMVFSFYSGKFQGGHAHEDQNNFTLYGYGEAFAVDNGYTRPARQSEAHNMVFVDGKGQHNAGGSIGTDGKIVEYLLSDFADYVFGDATAAYNTYSEFNETGHPFPDDDWSLGFDGGNPVNFARRRVLVVHGEPIPPYVIMLDDIEKDGDTHTYQWRMHTVETNTIDVSQNPIRILGERGFLDLHVLTPPFESLGVDRIDFDNQNEDPNTIILSLSLEAITAHFALLMLPANELTQQPKVTGEDFPWGRVLHLSWSAGAHDLFLVNRSEGKVDYVLRGENGTGIPLTTDARLLLVRMSDRRITGYLLSGGSEFDFAGVPHVRVMDSTLNVGRSGTTFDIDDPDAEFSFYAPDGGAVRYRDNTVRVLNDGGFIKPDLPLDGTRPPQATGALNLSAYPNPFNPATNLLVDIQKRGRVTVAVFDVQGRLVATVWNRVLPKGRNLLRWDGTNADGRPVATGIYFVRAAGAGVARTLKVILLK
ncbi:MAG: FlgD immunoglobulin-like domain containing protein [Candidatus Krumholzibacteria bacterium]